MTPALRCDFVIVECINFSYARQIRGIVDREATCKINRMPALSKDDKLQLLRIILDSRHADLREQNLNRQGKGHFHVSGMGHEALAAVSIQMEPDDYIVSYYRDRGLVLGRGMPTRKSNPLALNVLAPDSWRRLEGQDVQQVYDATAEAFEKIRAGSGPFFFWIRMERLSSHTSSDDQKLYRSAEELQALEKSDPLKCWKDQLIQEDVITAEEFAKLDNEVKERIRREYTEAEKAENPSPNDLLGNLSESPPKLNKEILPPGKYRIGDTVNKTLRAGLEDDSRRVLFGEDIEDPKGGVFRLTQKLSTEFPKQVFNSPLAESTILGVACGLAAYGKRPVFELQFIDFIYPGMNQLVTNISTLRWRSFGNWKCPAVFYAPYGAYLPGGSLWHSQANESALAHYPGLSVVIPSTPEDAAGLLWTAMHGEDPIIFLIPKHMFWAERESSEP